MRLDRERLFFWIGGIASVVTIVSAAITSIAALREKPPPPAWVFAAGYVAFAVTLVAIIIYLFYTRRRVERSLQLELEHHTRAFNALHHALGPVAKQPLHSINV